MIKTEDRHNILEEIARTHTCFTTLEVRYSDGQDFGSIAVWNLHSALIAAFEAGQKYPAPFPFAGQTREPANPSEEAVVALLQGFGEANPGDLAPVAFCDEWAAMAAKELRRRTGRLLESMETTTLQKIAQGEVNPALIARRLMAQNTQIADD